MHHHRKEIIQRIANETGKTYREIELIYLSQSEFLMVLAKRHEKQDFCMIWPRLGRFISLKGKRKDDVNVKEWTPEQRKEIEENVPTFPFRAFEVTDLIPIPKDE